MKVLVKSWKNQNERHKYGNKTNKNACIKIQHALNTMSLDYFINNNFCCDENEH